MIGRNHGRLLEQRTYLKNEFWFKIKAAVRNKPEEYIRYFEDLFQAPNAKFVPKDPF